MLITKKNHPIEFRASKLYCIEFSPSLFRWSTPHFFVINQPNSIACSLTSSVHSFVIHTSAQRPYDARCCSIHLGRHSFCSHLYLSFKRKMNQFTKNSKSLHFIRSSTSSSSMQSETHTKKRSNPSIQLVCKRRKRNEDLTWLGISFFLYGWIIMKASHSFSF